MLKFKLLLLLVLSLTACGKSGRDSKDPTPPPIPAPKPSDPEVPEVPSMPPDEVMDGINDARKSRALPLLNRDSGLVCAAAKHAADIGTRRSCSHTGSDGSSFIDRARSCGVFLQAGGEIIACGQGNAKAAVDAWLNSPGHRAIMLDYDQKKMGAGVFNNFWVVVFSK